MQDLLRGFRKNIYIPVTVKINSFRSVVLTALLLLFALSNSRATTYYPSSAGGNWNAGAGWSTTSCGAANCLCSPGLSSDVVSLSCAKTITVTASVSSGAVTISGGTLIVNSNVTLTLTSLSMTSGTLTVNGTLNVTSGGTGGFSITGGTFTGTGTVGLSGGAQALSSNQPFYGLNIAGSGDKTMGSDITVTNQLTLTANHLIVGSNTLTVGSGFNGNNISQTSGHILTTSGSSLNFGGSVVQTLGSILSTTFPATLTNFTMTSNLSTITLGTSQSLTVSGTFDLTAGGNFKIGANTLTLNGPVNMSGSCFCDQITGGSASNITIGTAAGGAASLLMDLSNTDAGGTNTIATLTNNRTSNSVVMLSSMRIGTALAQSSASSAVSIAASTSSQTLTIDGSLSGSGGFVGNSIYAYMVINGSGALGANLSFVNALSLAGLQINRSSGSVVLGSNLAVSGNVTMTQGTLDLNNKTLDLGTSGAITSETSANYIFCSACTDTTGLITSSGNSLSTANNTYTNIRGLGLDITTGNTVPGTTTINRGFGAESGGALSSSILRWYEISPATNAGLNATLNIKYWTSELNSLAEANLSLFNTAIGTSAWVNQNGSVNTGTHAISLSGINSFSEWTAGASSCTPPPPPVVAVTNNCGNSVLSTTSIGALLWSTSETTTAITVTVSGTYSVTTTVGGCTSSAGSGTATPVAIPSTPSVTVVNNCNHTSTLSTTATGALLWTGGSTASAIIVSAAGTYSVTTTVSTCVSPAGAGTASPSSTPLTPVVTVANNCGSSLLSTNASGTLVWSTSATTSAITTSAGTYSVTTTVNGCTSASGTGTAAPIAIPATPLVSVTNTCGSSLLSTTAAGSLLWSTLSTTSAITAMSAGTYSVTTTVSGCTSASGTGTAAPIATPSTPSVSVTNNCGSSLLSITATGTLLWSTSATTSAITTTASGTYSVTTTVNGCTSASGTGTAAPIAIPAIPLVSVTNTCGSSLLSTTAAGTLHWSTLATTSAITTTASGTYSVTTTVNGCTSGAGTGTAAPTAIPSTPSVTVVNNCNHTSTLSTTATGALLWTGGATTSAIIVSAAGTYSVTTRVNSCISPAGTGTASPSSAPSTPVVTVANDCGKSVLSTTATGALLWSTSATTTAITVTKAEAVTVTQTVNGCTSAAGKGTSAPHALPAKPVVKVVNDCGKSILSTKSKGTLLWSTGVAKSAITVTKAGTYSVTVTAKGCTSLAGTGIAAPKTCRVEDTTPDVPSTTMSLIAYPNPAHDKLNIDFKSDNTGEYTIKMFDITGRILLNKVAAGEQGVNHLEFDIGNFAKGLYILSFNSGAENKQVRIVIE